MDNTPIQAQPEMDFSMAETFVCEQCNNDQFVMHYLIKRFSALMSPTGREMIVPMQVFSCTKCNHINDEFLPGRKELT